MLLTDALGASRHALRAAMGGEYTTLASEKNYVAQVELHCTVVVTWFCASVFGSLVMLSPALRVFEVMMASRSNC
jgi:hypothetical protein